MNSTLTADTGDPASADSHFTHANLFGIYLTLVFCVLTQPAGNLLMDFRADFAPYVLKRLALFPLRFWRLNPIACGAEGWLILAILARTATGRWTSSSSTSRDAPLRIRLRRLLDEMHVAATALLVGRTLQPDTSKEKML